MIGLKPTAPLGNIPALQLTAYQRIATTMWGNSSDTAADGVVYYGRGRIYCTQNSHKAFTSMQIAPDFSFSAGNSDTTLDYIHRRISDTDIYFVRNGKDSPAKAVLSFRVSGKAPELWHVDTGEITPALIYRNNGAQTEVPLSFPAYGSVFIIFRHASSKHPVEISRDGIQVFPSIDSGGEVYAGATLQNYLYATKPGLYSAKLSNGEQRNLNISTPTAQLQFKAPWTLSFPPGWGAPASISMSTLKSWTESSIPDVRYFSGTATYTNTVQTPATLLGSKREIWMNLGDVHEIATVMVNGKELGTLWHAPFSVRIDTALHARENAVSIRVTNLWPNRLIGDQQPGAKVHYTHTNIEAYTKDSPLLPSGLLNPVTLCVADEVPLQ